MPKPTKAKRLLIDHLLLAFAHFKDGEHEEAAKVLQQASEISDVTDVVDEINEDQKEALQQEDQLVDDSGDAGTDMGGSGSDEVIPSDEELVDMDEENVQARLQSAGAKLKEARASNDMAAVRKCGRAIYLLHARARALRAEKEAATAKPVDRQARAFANQAKLKAGAKK